MRMSMQIVEKSGEGLSRVYGVTVPVADLTERLEARIKEIAPTLNVKRSEEHTSELQSH